MESFQISLHQHQVEAFKRDGADITGFLKLLFVPLSANYDQLKYAIEREFRINGSPDITRMDLDRVAFDHTSGKGSFRVILDISYTFSCEDVLTEKSDQTSEWTFFIDTGLGIIFFYGSPYVDSRTTADEF